MKDEGCKDEFAAFASFPRWQESKRKEGA
jgi:hypothetical protein